MNSKQTLLVVALVAGAVGPVLAEETAESIESLRQQLRELDQKIRILERQRELEAETAKAKAAESPRVVVGDGGLRVSSGDTNFVFQLRGILQVDSRTFFEDGGIQGNDAFLLRRARPIFQGTVYRDFDFLFVPDFGGSSPSIQDANLNYRYRPWLQLRAGRFKAPVGLEQLQSDAAGSFNERALPTSLVPNRDVGFQLWGEVGEGQFSYAAGVFNGVGDGRSTGNTDFEDHREAAGRLIVQPFRKIDLPALQGIGFGLAGSWGNVFSNASGLPATTGASSANAPGGYATDGQQQFFAYNPTNGTVVANGDHWRISPQAYYYWGPLGLLGEYVISHQTVSKGPLSADLEHTAWQISVGWVLTGEDATYLGVTPRRPFNPSAGRWGALQLVGRYAELDIDNAAFPVFADPRSSATAAQAWAVGLNWYLNRNLRANASFSRTTFDGGGRGSALTAPSIVTRQPEEIFFTRLQLAF